MKKILFAIVLAAASLFLLSCEAGYENYVPSKEPGNGNFDFPSNSFAADVVLDGDLNDERWAQSDVISLGSWDDSDAEVQGAIVTDAGNYSGSKRAIIKMFRGSVGFHFGFEVKDSDLRYLSLEDGDPAIWSDNILVNLCTAIDGAEIPMSDDYYLMVTAWGNYCFRRGAIAAGMWGAWSGVLDYQAKIHYEEDGETPTGFGVELVVPYSQIGLSKDSPIGVAFRSCDRTSSGALIEREWIYKGAAPFFNTPNTYVIWSADNVLYSYYDYPMPDVNVSGTIVDYVTGDALKDVALNVWDISAVTDEKGHFSLGKINANSDLVIIASGDGLMGEQEIIVSKDELRALKGGNYSVYAALLTTANKVTQTVSGMLETINSQGEKIPAANVKIRAGDSIAVTDSSGSYSLDVTFDSTEILWSAECGDTVYEKQISVSDALKGALIVNADLPLMSKMPNKFGDDNDVETYLGWTDKGLFVRMTGTGKTNGYAVAFSVNGTSGKIVLYHAFGTMCITDFVNYSWNYDSPSAFGVEADQQTFCDGRNVFTFVIPYSQIGTDKPCDIKIAPFEYTSAGPFAYYGDSSGNYYLFGDVSVLNSYPVLKSEGSIEISETQVVSSYVTAEFGKGGAKATFEKIEGSKNGIRVTFEFIKEIGHFGFGVMFGDVNGKGTTDLYATGYGTVDHREYGDWAWNGNYVPAANLGIESSETAEDGRTVITLFYSYETLSSSAFGLNIKSSSDVVKFQLFEYVIDASGDYFGCYNRLKDGSGNLLSFDAGVDNFITL